MRKTHGILAIAVIVLAAAAVSAQTSAASIKSSPAYAEVLLRKTELMADLDAYSIDYTEANPKVLDARSELNSLNKSIDRLLAVKPGDAERLTQAVGMLMVKKAAFDSDLQRLMRSYNKDHPEVKRAERRAQFFESAINEILK